MLLGWGSSWLSLDTFFKELYEMPQSRGAHLLFSNKLAFPVPAIRLRLSDFSRTYSSGL
jgi:hypothetical protein